MKSRSVELENATWEVVDAISNLQGWSYSDVIANLIKAATGSNPLNISFNDRVDTSGGDIVGGNVDRTQNQRNVINGNVGGDVVGGNNVVNVHCKTLQLTLDDGSFREFIVDGNLISTPANLDCSEISMSQKIEQAAKNTRSTAETDQDAG